ncbi:hypothetical protein CDQ84_11615 [Clostridium thermosuccinogenes]|jgi:hypothetical protein|uniref:Uncharacterized protein n=1 Tax=Clostridium thermosuccinogenes TaxID=84032 RepID=A0A2K2FCG8_9CLOT|nr:hypothetical protein [Pseudoclostridium thermosuccinogenes]AUS98256.1 hypothetical protein CDO33_18415 [Pseudoclostridium thermosuccinogenes]PNT96482.1 hypothetical protein CDQ85_11630 [Pseudoclostridium thermosuccinogenes]PNT98138.1 hypothetical protein CDQ84_11615 [Pseudoclostridium thermosuccinogenes]
MVIGSTKRIVVIKDIPSNMIEEAILILKCEPKSWSEKNTGNTGGQVKKYDKDFIFKEAEMIINNYIKENNLSVKGKKRELEKPSGAFKNNMLLNALINLGFMGSVALLVFLITRFF